MRLTTGREYLEALTEELAEIQYHLGRDLSDTEISKIVERVDATGEAPTEFEDFGGIVRDLDDANDRRDYMAERLQEGAASAGPEAATETFGDSFADAGEAE